MKHRKFSILILIAFCAISMSGCMGKKDITKEVLEHMQNKYDDTFEYAAPFGGGMGNVTTQMLLTSEKYPGKTIWIECYVDEDDNINIVDNYLSIKYEQQTAELINEIIDKTTDKDFAVFYDLPLQAFTKGASKETTFEEYISQPSSDICFIAIVDAQGEIDRDAFEQELEKNIVESGLCCRIGDVFFDSSGNYNSITIENLESYIIKDLYDYSFTFCMADNESIDYKEWNNPED